MKKVGEGLIKNAISYQPQENLPFIQFGIYSDYNLTIVHWYCSGGGLCLSLAVIFTWGMAQPPIQFQPQHSIFFATACAKQLITLRSARMAHIVPLKASIFY